MYIWTGYGTDITCERGDLIRQQMLECSQDLKRN